MNFQANPQSFVVDANLRGWGDYCRHVTADSLPKAILHVCQAVYDVMGEGAAKVALKVAVFHAVSDGDCSAAVQAMLPPGAETSLEQLPGGRTFAQLAHPGTGACVSAEGNLPESALLGCMIELSLRLEPGDRAAILG